MTRKRIEAGLGIDHNINSKLAGGPFVQGCTNFKKDVLRLHQKSKGHVDAKIKFDARRMPPGNSVAEKAIEQLNKSVMDKLCVLMRTAHGIAKHSGSFRSFCWISEMDEKKGVVVGQTYRNDKSCREFIKAIAAVERKKITELLKEAKFMTILSDGSTDVATIENEIVYIRFSISGVIRTFFIGMIPVEKADANGVFQSLKKAVGNVTDDEPAMEKIVAYCCDGASVNTGQTGGVIALLRNEVWSGIVLINCLVHRLELSFKDGMKQVKIYEKFISLLSGIFTFYHVSPLQRSNLKRACNSLGTSPVMPLRVGGTHWVGHTTSAIENLWTGYKAIVLHLGQMSQDGNPKLKAKAQSFLKLLRSKSVIVFGHFVNDVLCVLKNLSMDLQRNDATIYECHQKLEVVVESLKKMQARPGYHLRQVIDKDEFQGQKLEGNLSMHSAGVTKVLDSLIQSVKKRYADTQEKGVLNATKIANLSRWPITQESITDFGDDCVGLLVDHFSEVLNNSGVQTQLMEHEWTSLKHAIYDRWVVVAIIRCFISLQLHLRNSRQDVQFLCICRIITPSFSSNEKSVKG